MITCVSSQCGGEPRQSARAVPRLHKVGMRCSVETQLALHVKRMEGWSSVNSMMDGRVNGCRHVILSWHKDKLYARRTTVMTFGKARVISRDMECVPAII